MEIKKYLETLNPAEKQQFAVDCGTSIAYLSQLAHGHRMAGAKAIAAIERASGGVVTYRDLRPDLYPSTAA